MKKFTLLETREIVFIGIIWQFGHYDCMKHVQRWYSLNAEGAGEKRVFGHSVRWTSVQGSYIIMHMVGSQSIYMKCYLQPLALIYSRLTSLLLPK